MSHPVWAKPFRSLTHGGLLSVATLLAFAPLSARAYDLDSLPAPPPGTVHLSPLEITREGLDFRGSQGFLFVPENRAVPDSRTIAVHFMFFPAKEESGLGPVFYLPGGPGDYYDERRFYEYYGGERARLWTTELTALNRYRPLVIVNQRGNSRAPGFLPSLRCRVEQAPLDRAENENSAGLRYTSGLESAIAYWTERGFDLAGYDILNISHDLEDLRIALGYDRIALRGGSFGSQWAFAYMEQWPERVDYAVLSGVEPLDYAYDHPQHIWNTVLRVDSLVNEQTGAARILAEHGGIAGAIRKLVSTLQSETRTVTIADEDGDSVAVVLGAYDFQQSLMSEEIETWPRFLAELLAGDYRYLASRVIEARHDRDGGLLIEWLIDNSLGVSAEREAEMLAAPARDWLGDPNFHYAASRGVTPTPVMPDAMRASARSRNLPVVMIHGDLDFSTPIENAEWVLDRFPNAKLIPVRNGGHSAVWDALRARPEWIDDFSSLLTDLERPIQTPDNAPDSDPSTADRRILTLSPPVFDVETGVSLYEELLRDE